MTRLDIRNMAIYILQLTQMYRLTQLQMEATLAETSSDESGDI